MQRIPRHLSSSGKSLLPQQMAFQSKWLLASHISYFISDSTTFHFKFSSSSCCLLPLEKWANRSSKNKSNLSTTYYIGSGQKKSVPIIFIYLVYYKLCLSFEVWEECESLRTLQKELVILIPSCLLVNMTIGLSYDDRTWKFQEKSDLSQRLFLKMKTRKVKNI